MASEVREQLLKLDGVLVWVNPISDGQNRIGLDAMLRDVASSGIWVSAHPDVILKMGVKEVLHRTKHLGWGTDTHLYRAARALPRSVSAAASIGGPACPQAEPRQWRPGRLEGRARFFIRGRGCDRSRAAGGPGSVPEDVALGDFMRRCEAYFAGEGCIVDQPFQPRLPDGMIRCYMGADRVVGFGHQFIKALIPPPPEGPDSKAAQPGPRIMHPASAPDFRRSGQRWNRNGCRR